MSRAAQWWTVLEENGVILCCCDPLLLRSLLLAGMARSCSAPPVTTPTAVVSCHARQDGMPLLISASTLSIDCGGADMTWQVTHSCGTKPPSRQDCWNYSSGCTCWRGAGWAAVPWTPSHHAVATTHRWPKVHADVVTAAALVCFSGRAAPRAWCPGLSRSQGCSAVLMDACNACGTLARVPNAGRIEELAHRPREIARDRVRSREIM